ncbi:MAG: sigma-54 dependent transcriptional regulator [Candidatus Binatia bacterium]|jgi:two-component system, NtrC family, response regulator AtoC
MPHALVLEDDLNFQSALAELVEREGFSTSVAGTLEEARAVVAKRPPDVALVDLQLPDGNGMDLFREMEGPPSTEIVLITGHASVDTAVDALRLGVSDYLTKPLDVARLKTVLANVARVRELKEEVGTLRAALRELGHFGLLVGTSPAMQKVYDMITRVAATDATVLLTGESGTGKDLVAQTLHELSRRRQAPFLPLNCGAVSPSLIESEMFGHERGSFTGADRLHKGYFERATGGTLFLDEITEMAVELQVKLLRVLETATVLRIGGERPVSVDVRVIASTNRRPEEAVVEGKLREDLLYRLKVFPIHLPPLRERGGDIELLAESFLEQLNKAEGTNKMFTKAAVERLRAHSWPGNVRELKNLVHHVFILADDEIGPNCLPPELFGGSDSSGPSLQLKVGVSLAEADRRLILATLNEFGDNKKKAAEVLGISLKTLYNRINDYKAA